MGEKDPRNLRQDGRDGQGRDMYAENMTLSQVDAPKSNHINRHMYAKYVCQLFVDTSRRQKRKDHGGTGPARVIPPLRLVLPNSSSSQMGSISPRHTKMSERSRWWKGEGFGPPAATEMKRKFKRQVGIIRELLCAKIEKDYWDGRWVSRW